MYPEFPRKATALYIREWACFAAAVIQNCTKKIHLDTPAPPHTCRLPALVTVVFSVMGCVGILLNLLASSSQAFPTETHIILL